MDYSTRLFLEHGALHRRTEKLKVFILSDKYDELPEMDRKDLKDQLGHMEGYASVLNRRVSRQCG